VPLVRIDLGKSYSPEVRQTIGEVIYQAMTEIANVPPHDRFQILTLHDDNQLAYPQRGYLGNNYTPGIIFIQVLWVAGRSTEVKKAFYRRIADRLHAEIGVRAEDVWITLAENAREDWSFGGGDMQYAPK
jgi:phenylpyruvate tautomerase PptA (4-oxalocrotonate tautomerase family)